MKKYILLLPFVFLLISGCAQQPKNMNVNVVVERYDTVQEDYIKFMTVKDQQQIKEGKKFVKELTWSNEAPPRTIPNYRFYDVAEDSADFDIKPVMYYVWFDEATATAIISKDDKKTSASLDNAQVNAMYDLLVTSSKK
ncbi:MAG: hypothetical protein ACI4XN_11725 [Candidatus Kurthia intestinigallinarum]